MSNLLQKYKSISFLIVDDFSEFRLSLKQMVESFGATHIDVCTDAESALQCYAEHGHTILLVDYNLGEGLSGLQLLEELNHRSLLKASTSFVLLTGETALDLVMGAIEYRPNDYLAKPFTRTTLKKRLDKLVELNTLVKPIYDALDANKPNKAIATCEHLMQANKRLTLLCLRLKAEILLKQTHYQQALNVYQSLIKQREVNWALMGVAQCYNGLGQTDKTITACKKIITKNKSAVEAYDLLTECYLSFDDFACAYEVIKESINRSPNSISRQRAYAQLALRYNELETAYNALKKAVAIGKFSYLLKVEDYANLLLIALKIQLGANKGLSRRITKDYTSIYSQLNKRFSAPSNQLLISLHKALHAAIINRESHNELTQVLSKIKAFPDDLPSYFLAFLELCESLSNDRNIIAQIQSLTAPLQSTSMRLDNPKKSADYNRQGMLKYQQKNYREAVSAFKTALFNAPNNPNISLNLLKSYHHLLSEDPKVIPDKHLYQLCHHALQFLAPSDHRFLQSKSLLLNVKTRLKGEP